MPRIDSLPPLEFEIKYQPSGRSHTYVCTIPEIKPTPPSIDELYYELKSKFSDLKSFSSQNWGKILFVDFNQKLSDEEFNNLRILVETYKESNGQEPL